MKIIMNIIKRLVIALVLLYSINVIINISGEIIPINIYSITLVAIFGIPAVFTLLIIKYLIL